MKGGTIVLLSGAEIRTGAWMNRGTILSLVPLQLMPTFSHATDCNPVFVNLLSRRLAPFGVRLPCTESEGRYSLHHGDHAVPGKGEILIWQPAS
jgi:formylmethanofuran dehydrogenase subunit C